MSTEYQPHSPLNQAQTIADYASRRGYEIVRTYEDEARSGLTISGRPGLKQLIQDVVSGKADYKAVLVYDVSRWGRFQDIDESAHYEFLCRQMSIELHYCAEGFENDGSSVSSLLKNMKRVMAAEYSRDLGQRIRHGRYRVASAGFWTGGPTPFGYQRVLVDVSGAPKQTLEPGQRKSLFSDRIIAVPGPPDEVATVRRIFDMYVRKGFSYTRVERELNRAGARTREGVPWSGSSIRHLLANEIYIGTNVFGGRHEKRSAGYSRRAELPCLKKERSFKPIVSARLFALAQDLMPHRIACPRKTDAQLLAELCSLLDRHGEFARRIARTNPNSFGNATYQKRFGSIAKALAMVGLTGLPAEPARPARRYLRNRVLDEMRVRFRELGLPAMTDSASQHEVLPTGMRIAVVSFRTTYNEFCRRCWAGYLDSGIRPDFTIIIRAARWAEEIGDLYLVGPQPLNLSGLPPPKLGLIPDLEPYRSPDLGPLYARAQVASWVAGLMRTGIYD